MKKTIIHIGLHKTATTFLQEYVWPNVPNYTYLSRPFTQLNHGFNQLQYADDTLYNKDLVLNELDKINTDRLLLSDESFSGKPVFLSCVNRAIIANRLKTLFPDAEIILFLRDQTDMILSYYSTYIKMPYGVKPIEQLFYKPGDNYNYTDYLANPNSHDLSKLYYNTNDYFIHLDCFLYTPLVKFYQNLFNQCHVFLYEDFKKDISNTKARLESILEEPIQIETTKPINISLSSTELESQRLANCFSQNIKNRTMTLLVKRFFNVLPGIGKKELRTVVDDTFEGYYTNDNKKLKLLLPYLNWEKYPDKYK